MYWGSVWSYLHARVLRPLSLARTLLYELLESIPVSGLRHGSLKRARMGT